MASSKFTAITMNEFILWPYRYIRRFVPSSTVRKNPQYKTIVDNVKSITIVVAAIPDGMSLLQLSKINDSMIMRLNVFAREPLEDKFLNSVDDSYGDTFYPIVGLLSSVASAIYTLPVENFYAISRKAILPDGVALDMADAYAGAGELVEYRYLQQRQFKPIIIWDPNNGNIYRFAMPRNNKTTRCIIMPENFIRIAVDRGYWNFDGLIIHVFARDCTLVGGSLGMDSQSITSISNDDPRTLAIITSFLSKIGMHKIESTAINQIYSIDKYMTVVVGSLNNLNL